MDPSTRARPPTRRSCTCISAAAALLSAGLSLLLITRDQCFELCYHDGVIWVKFSMPVHRIQKGRFFLGKFGFFVLPSAQKMLGSSLRQVFVSFSIAASWKHKASYTIFALSRSWVLNLRVTMFAMASVLLVLYSLTQTDSRDAWTCWRMEMSDVAIRRTANGAGYAACPDYQGQSLSNSCIVMFVYGRPELDLL